MEILKIILKKSNKSWEFDIISLSFTKTEDDKIIFECELPKENKNEQTRAVRKIGRCYR